MNKDYLTEWLKTYLPQRDLKWREGFAKELLALFEAEQEKLVEKAREEELKEIQKKLIQDWSIFFEIGKIEGIGIRTENKELVEIGEQMAKRLNNVLKLNFKGTFMRTERTKGEDK